MKSVLIDLSAESFEPDTVNLKSKKCTAVLWYSPHCGHCHDFMPVWNKVANIAMFFDICRINIKQSEAEAKLSTKMNIIGVPTVWLYRKGKPIEIYNGPREVDSILKTVMEFCG